MKQNKNLLNLFMFDSWSSVLENDLGRTFIDSFILGVSSERISSTEAERDVQWKWNS